MPDMPSSPHIILPPELWCHIASFFTLDEMQQVKLYTLNRSLLAFYLRQKYNRLSFYYTCGSLLSCDNSIVLKLRQTLDSLYTMIPGNVRNLNVILTQRSMIDPVPRGRLSSRVLRKLFSIFGKEPKSVLAKKKIAEQRDNFPSLQQIHSAFSELKALTSIRCQLVSISSPPIIDFNPFLSFALSGALGALGSSRNTLTSLALTLEMYPLPDLGIDDFTFPCLQTFEFCLYGSRASLSAGSVLLAEQQSLESAAGSMMRFLHRHRDILNCFIFKCPSRAQKFAAGVLAQFPAMPALRELKLEFDLDRSITNPSFPMALLHTLESASSSLTKLILVLRPPDFHLGQTHEVWWTLRQFFGTGLPRLEYLKLCIEHVPLTIHFISRAQLPSTVKILYSTMSLNQSNIRQLASIFERARGGCCLQTLSLSISTFTPATLRCLAQAFPNLEKLCVWYVYIGLEEHTGNDLVDLTAVYEGFSNVTYPEWRLERLDLNDPIMLAQDHDGERFRRVVTQALPRVQFFNGMSREDYISWGTLSRARLL